MFQRIFPDITVIVLVLTLHLPEGISQISDTGAEKIMFYNVENFFDTIDDSLTDDNDFLPDGLMRWSLTRYNKKINSLYKTIIAAGEWEPPAVVAFCEIENRKVLEDLIFGTNLSKFDYGIIHQESPDRRGIDVCLIYRKNAAKVLSFTYLIPEVLKNQNFNSRSVLYAKILSGSDTIHFFVNHWPSRRGGVLAGEYTRMQIASMLKGKVDSISARGKSSAKIIILGDFNCTPDDQDIQSLITDDSLDNLSGHIRERGIGTYRYMGRWEVIDQVIVSKGILNSKSGIYCSPEPLKIFHPDFLLKKDAKYPGTSPYSTYSGYRYQGGYSDHLPVILELRFR
jgi:hypothetical protein